MWPAGILLACKDKSASSSSVKIEALTFMRAALEANPPAVFKPHVEQLSTGATPHIANQGKLLR